MKAPPITPKTAALLVGIAIAAVVVLRAFIIEPAGDSRPAVVTRATPYSQDVAPAAAKDGSPSSTIGQPIPSESVQRNLRSNRGLSPNASRAEIDQAFLYVFMNCASLNPDWSAATAVRHTMGYAGRAITDEGLIIGSAAEITRMESFARAKSICVELYVALGLSDDQLKAIRAGKASKEHRALNNAFFYLKQPNTPEVKAALEAVVSERMYGLLTSALYQHLDTTSLEKSFGEGRGAALSSAAINIIQCRLGADCGRGGLFTENLCWQHAICGENLEAAFIANLRERGVDPTAFSRYVDRIVEALLKADTSIFRVPDKPNEPWEKGNKNE
jgi:hypothetical protein